MVLVMPTFRVMRAFILLLYARVYCAFIYTCTNIMATELPLAVTGRKTINTWQTVVSTSVIELDLPLSQVLLTCYTDTG